MSLVVTGNSHVWMLRDVVESLPNVSKLFQLGNGKFERDAFSRRDGDRVLLTQSQYDERLRRHLNVGAIDARYSWMFVNVNHNARIYRDEMWIESRPAGLDPYSKFPISKDVLDAVIRRDQAGLRAFYTDLRQAGIKFFAISAPPPRRDHPAVSRGIPLDVISHIDSSARDIWRQWLRYNDVPFVEVPAAACDEQGFLRESFAQTRVVKGVRDAHHANSAYGRLLLPELLERIAGLE